MRERFLGFDELSLLLNCIYKANIRTQWKIAVHLLVLLLCRKNELLQSSWNQIDLAEAKFSLPENKTNRPTTIPLPRQAVKLFEILKQLNDDSEFVFVGKTGNKPSHNALNQIIKFTETLLDEQFTIHDIRRTGASLLPKMGVDFLVVEVLLNHEFRHGSSKHYFHHDYYPERAKALQMWADKLDELIQPNLIPYDKDFLI